MCFQVNFVKKFVCMKLPTNNGRAVLTCDFYCFGVYAAPRLFDIFSSKNTAAFTPANTVVYTCFAIRGGAGQLTHPPPPSPSSLVFLNQPGLFGYLTCLNRFSEISLWISGCRRQLLAIGDHICTSSCCLSPFVSILC